MKMHKIRIIGGMLILGLLSGCGIGALSSSYTARSNGAGNWTLDSGVVDVDDLKAPYLRISRGFSRNIDLGVSLEESFSSLNSSLWGKFSVINAQEYGFSLAATGGYMVANDFHSWFLGPIASYKFNRFEPYATAVFTSTQIKDDLTAFGTPISVEKDIKYVNYIVGTTFWPLEWLGITVNASMLQDIDSAELSHRVLFNGGVSLRL